MTDQHGPDRLDSLIVKSTETQMASAQVLRQAYDLLQAAHAAIDRARSLQRRHELTIHDDGGLAATHERSETESRGEIRKATRRPVSQDASPFL